MNSRKPKAGSRGGSVAAGAMSQQSFSRSVHVPAHVPSSRLRRPVPSPPLPPHRYAKQSPRATGTGDKTPSSPIIQNEVTDSKPAAAPTEQMQQSAVEGVYQNGRIIHTVSSLIGSIVQVVVRDGHTYEGVLQTFSPEFEIAIAAATEIDKKTVSEGNNIGHLISSLCNNHEMQSLRLFPIKNVVTISCLNTDMDFASSGSFQTDEELGAKSRVETSEERTLVPWSSDDVPDEGRPDGVRRPNRAVDLDGDNSNGWTAEEMFAVNTGLGVRTGFQELDGMYTIALNKTDTPEGLEKQKQAEAIAREIENNQTSKRRAEQENSDDRTEEEQFSSVTRTAETFRHPKAHPNLPGNRSDEMNWRQQSNRSQQNAHSKTAGYSGGGKNSSPSVNQQAAGGSGGRDPRQSYPPGPRGRHQMQNQMPLQQQPQQQQTPPQQHHHHQQQQPATINQAPVPHSAPQRQQAANAVPAPIVQSPKSDVPSKSIASAAPPTPPNYAKVVAEDGSGTRNAKSSSKRKDDVVPAEQPVKAAAPPVSSPVTEKKELPVKEKASPTEAAGEKKDDAAATPKAESESVESIAKNSKLNPNAKEFTLNPAAKPFTPRSQQPAVAPQHHTAPPVQYSNQPQNIVAQVHHTPHQHFQQQNPPQMVQIQTQGVPRMPNQQVLLHQMVGPGGNMFPYPVVMPQYQQQVQMNQPRPGKQNSKYQNPGNRNDQYNQNSPHNVAAATGHPVLATAPITYQQQPGLAQLFHPMYQMQGFNPRMQVGMMGPQVSYDPSHMYRK